MKRLLQINSAFLLVFILLIGFTKVQAQQTVSGMVTHADDEEPLPGVNIRVTGTTTGTTTGANGQYELTIESLQDTLVFSFIGYQTQNVPINGRTEINVNMQSQAVSGEEMVVVGYGTQQKSDVTGSISSIGEDELTQQSPTNVFEAMQGKMSGVQLTTTSGAPGENASLRIRGVSTFSGGSEPLYVIDGQPVDNIDRLNPNNIESIEVLKDGSSAAIYGSKSANGVVLITTKSGAVGETQIDASYSRSYTKTRIMPTATTNERIDYEMFRGVIGHSATIDSLNQQFYVSNNWQKLVYRPAPQDKLNIGVSSGSEKASVYWNLGFIREEGVILNTGYKRLNSRLNVDFNLNEWISVGTRTNFYYDDKKNTDPSIEPTMVGQTLTRSPFARIYDAEGNFTTNVNSYRGRQNPIRAYNVMSVKRKNYGGTSFSHAIFDLADNLSYRANVGIDLNYARNSDYFPEFIQGRDDVVDKSVNSTLSYNWIHESIINYDNSFGAHEISAVAGFSAQKWSAPVRQIDAQLSNSLLPTINNASQIFIGGTNTLNENNHSLASIFGRISYNYQSKYLLSATFRRDGSSRFGSENKWGNFPSLSVGWRFSEEPFMEDIEFISNAKIRASYAITGNERIGNADYSTQLGLGNFYNGVNGIGLSSRLGNPSIKWEQTTQKNVGLDIEFLEGRVNFNFDYYVKETNDLLANQPLPAVTGLNNVRVNVGDVDNRGIEIGFQATPYDRNNLTWDTNFNFSINTNEVQKLAGGTPILTNNHITRVGSPVGSFYGYTVKGVFAYDQSNAFTPEGNKLTPNFDDNGNFENYTLNGSEYNEDVKQITVGGITPAGGDFYWKDRNGDFKIDAEDREILGSPFPKYYGGFNNQISYKNFSFSFLFDFQFDAQVYNSFMSSLSQLRQNSQTPPPFVLDNLWEGPGDETAIYPGGPRRSQNELGDSDPTSQWVEDAKYIKLRNIRLSYSLSPELAEKLSLNNLTIYGVVNNALVWTSYRGFDPEVNIPGNPLNAGVDQARYPQGREFLVGIDLNF